MPISIYYKHQFAVWHAGVNSTKMNLSVFSFCLACSGCPVPPPLPAVSIQMILINLGGGWFGLVCLKCFSSAPDQPTNEGREERKGTTTTKRSRDRYRRRRRGLSLSLSLFFGSIPSQASGHTTVILEQPQNLLLQQRRYHTDRLICILLKKQITSLRKSCL